MVLAVAVELGRGHVQPEADVLADAVAGLLDAIENTALLRVLDGYEAGSISGVATKLAAGAAAVKFAIVIAAGLYVVSALLALGKRAVFE